MGDTKSKLKKSEYQFKNLKANCCNEHQEFGSSVIFETQIFDQKDLRKYQHENRINREQHHFDKRSYSPKKSLNYGGGSKLDDECHVDIDHKLYPLKRIKKSNYDENDDSCIKEGKYPIYESGVQFGHPPNSSASLA